MDYLITHLNRSGAAFADIAIAMIWQSALVVTVIAVIDFALRNRISAKARYILWLLVLAKLVLPPSLALPTSPAWWWPQRSAAELPKNAPGFRVTFGGTQSGGTQTKPGSLSAAPASLEMPRLKGSGWLLLIWGSGAVALAIGLLRGWSDVRTLRRESLQAPNDLQQLADELAKQIGLKRSVPIRLSSGDRTPAVCGCLNPVILLPESLDTALPRAELKAVLLHELVHVHQGDLWVNLAQAILQLAWWCHPLVWLANARIRTLREQAVDERVIVELSRANADRGEYPAALLSIARMCARRDTFGLALLGIMEHRHSLKTRVRRILDMPDAWRPENSILVAGTAIVASLVLLPMGCGSSKPALASGADDPLAVRTYRVDQTAFKQNIEAIFGTNVPPGSPADESLPDVQRRVRGFFRLCGVDFPVASTNASPGQMATRALFYNDRTGILFVRASSNDLDTVEKAIQAANSQPGQIQIEARFIGIKLNDFPALDAKYGGLLSSNGSVLTESQTSSILAAMRKQEGVDLLSAPRVTTLSGRGAQIEVGDPIYFFDPTAGKTNSVSTGVACEILGFILPDDLTLRLSAKATVTDFLGYKKDQPAPLLRVRSGSATLQRIGDGQSLVLVVETGNSSGSTNSIPVLGDLPVLGRLFRSKNSGAGDRNVIALVTPTMIDPAGQRIHPPRKPPVQGF
jgi:beta-lactamase regulating signal transducer with metallopeptidase domain